MAKLWTWSRALSTAAQGLVFWSPTTFRRSQRFVHVVNQFAFEEKYRNPELRTMSVKTVIENLDFGSVRLDAYGPYCGQSPLQILALCAIAKDRRPRLILEIGTFQGFTTLLLALNTPNETHIVTVDLPPGPVSTKYPVTESGLVEKRGARTDLWAAYGVQERITQLCCDSATLTPDQLPTGIEMVLVDGSHSYEYVKSDTELAFKVLATDGIVLWDDYAPTKEEEIYRFLNELASERPLVHINETNLVMYDPGFKGRDDPELRGGVQPRT